jgi:hypothetical protein
MTSKALMTSEKADQAHSHYDLIVFWDLLTLNSAYWTMLVCGLHLIGYFWVLTFFLRDHSHIFC